MKREPVKSSNIRSIGWDSYTQTLEIEFLATNEVYQYDGVPFTEYDALMKAPSVGKFFARFIQPRYPARKLPLEYTE